jgi:hypothetical protein
MSAKKRRSPTEMVGSSDPKRLKVPELDTCSFTEGINPLFDPNSVLLRRVFFLDPEKTNYISVGYYPSRNYQPLVEIGSPKTNPLTVTNLHVSTLAEHLPAQCDALCQDECYRVLDGDFKKNTAGSYKTAIISLGQKKAKKSIFFKVQELRYLSYILYTVQNQLIRNTEALPDVMNYVLMAISSTTFVERPAGASKNILYYQLFEEIKPVI